MISSHRTAVLAVSCAVIFGTVPTLPAAGTGKVEPIGAFEGPAPQTVKNALVPEGYRVTGRDGKAICRLWLRRELPDLTEGALVGVISFPDNWSDFRDQTIRPGTYTLRYVRIPVDGDHMGVSPTSDFLLLLPLDESTGLAPMTDFDHLTETSAKISGTQHPAPLNLANPEEQTEFPQFSVNEDDFEVLYIKVKTPDAEIPLGLVMVGTAEQ